jgi:hypothetical protein
MACLYPLIICGHLVENVCKQISDLQRAKTTFIVEATIASFDLHSNA